VSKGENGLRIIGARLKIVSESSVDRFRNRLDTADSYTEVWQAVKDTVKFSLGARAAQTSKDAILILEGCRAILFHHYGHLKKAVNRG